jgi:hypothetical protein
MYFLSCQEEKLLQVGCPFIEKLRHKKFLDYFIAIKEELHMFVSCLNVNLVFTS